MVKSKASCLAKLPKEQRCQFLIGPVSSWFMPNTSDIWTQSKSIRENNGGNKPGDIMDCDLNYVHEESNATTLSYFIYGSIGCFCYGEIHNQSVAESNHNSNQMYRSQTNSPNRIAACVNRLIDVKEDNSRVCCVRFLKTSLYPLAMVLTESGALLVHDCLSSENYVHFKKSELLNKLIGPELSEDDSEVGHCNKKPRLNVTQQIISCLWPTAKNVFLSISLLKEKTNLLLWLKVKDLTEARTDFKTINKTEFIESFERLDLDLPQYSSPVCCMESVMLNSETCLIAIAMDDGLITVVKVNFNDGQFKRVIKLARHHDQVCSMSFHVGNNKKFPMGLLASASRNGLILVWDVENEFYFADYQAAPDGGRSNSRINWFALSFVTLRDSKHVHLAVSNSESGLSLLEIPDNTRSKIRLKENKDNKTKKQQGAEQTRHHALLFNIVFDPMTETIMTSSLDGNHILWNIQQVDTTGKKGVSPVDIKSQYLIPSMQNNSRTHMMRHSPIREDLLGIALGKSGVRFYKIASNLMNHRFDMNPSCSLVARKITKASLTPTSIAWHPSHEYRLAIGTLEGKVLRADLTPRKATLTETETTRAVKSKRSPENSADSVDAIFGVEYQPLERVEGSEDESYKRVVGYPENSKTDGVYSLCWGPNPTCPQDVSRLAIYAIGSISHKLFIYHNKRENNDKLTNYLDEFLDQSLPEANGEASEVAWKPSLDLMALGTTTGKIIIVEYLDEAHADRSRNNLFKKLAVIQGTHLGHTYVQCLAWHPTTDKDDPHYYFIAASANESPAFVFNIKETVLVADVKTKLQIEVDKDDNQKEDLTANIISTYAYKLDAHKKAISDIAWNPHEPLELATSSFDRYCQLWSLDEAGASGSDARVMSKFSARDRLFTLEWSLVDKDLIFTSGHDSTIWAWRPSENRFKNEMLT